MNQPVVRLYYSEDFPDHWISHQAHGRWFLFPRNAGGWAHRRPYHGAHQLHAVSPETTRLVLEAAGYNPADAIA